MKFAIDTPPGTPCELCGTGKRGRRRVQTRLEELPWLCPRCREALVVALHAQRMAVLLDCFEHAASRTGAAHSWQFERRGCTFERGKGPSDGA